MPNRPIRYILVLVFFSASLAAGCASRPAQEALPTEYPGNPPVEAQTEAPGAGMEPITADSLYYYADGKKVQLTPSLEWIAVQFKGAATAQDTATLQDSIVDVDREPREIPAPAITLLPLKKGLSAAQVVAGISVLRQDRTHFLQVSPVFVDGTTEMIVGDQFIAGFPAEKGKEDIDTINSQHGVEIVEALLGQENTYTLRVTENAKADTLSLANWYQESGAALYAAPDFIRLMQN